MMTGRQKSFGSGDATARDDAAAGGIPWIAITSGKGGVGKTTLAVNLAATLAAFDRRVLLIDAHHALGDAAPLLGIDVEGRCESFLGGSIAVAEALVEARPGLWLLPGATGAPSLSALSNEKRARLVDGIQLAAAGMDLVLIDTATGVSEDVVYWLAAASLLLVVTTPDPTALVDAYAVIKVAARLRAAAPVALVVNGAEGDAQAREIHERVALAAGQSLGIHLPLLGHLVDEPLIREAARRGEPISTLLPSADVSLGVRRLARRLMALPGAGAGAGRCVAARDRELEPVG